MPLDMIRTNMSHVPAYVPRPIGWGRAPGPLSSLPCEVHWFDLRDSAWLTPEELSEFERMRAARLAGEVLQRRYIAAHVALRRLLSARVGVEPQRLQLADGAGGKPRLLHAGSPLTFNLSRSGDLAVVALSDRVDVGVDVEAAHPLFESAEFRERILTAHESRRVEALPRGDQSAFVRRLWVRKEAVVKALGVGLKIHPTSIEVDDDTSPAIAGHGSGRWADLPVPDARVSAAVAVA